jgi:chemotaxis protein MotA
MDIASFLGLFIGIGSLIWAYTMDQRHLQALLLLSAFIIVVGGSFGSVALFYGTAALNKNAAFYLKTCFKRKIYSFKNRLYCHDL